MLRHIYTHNSLYRINTCSKSIRNIYRIMDSFPEAPDEKLMIMIAASITGPGQPSRSASTGAQAAAWLTRTGCAVIHRDGGRQGEGQDH